MWIYQNIQEKHCSCLAGIHFARRGAMLILGTTSLFKKKNTSAWPVTSPAGDSRKPRCLSERGRWDRSVFSDPVSGMTLKHLCCEKSELNSACLAQKKHSSGTLFKAAEQLGTLCFLLCGPWNLPFDLQVAGVRAKPSRLWKKHQTQLHTKASTSQGLRAPHLGLDR